MDKESLRVSLLRNNTVVISAALDVAVPARTWIWKGINFGLLGCLKISSCAANCDWNGISSPPSPLWNHSMSSY